MNTKEQFLKIQSSVAALYRPKIQKALQNQIDNYIAAIQKHGIEHALQHADEFNTRIGPVILNLYVDAGLRAARYSHKSLKTVKAATMGLNKRWTAEILDYYNKYILNKVVLPLSKTTEKQIKAILEKAIQEGWGVERVIKELKTSDITKWRARLIARTESTRGTNWGGMVGAHTSDLEMLKKWNSIFDMRTRKTHKHASGVGGEIQELTAPYSNGLMFPGDPEGGAEEVCNCRCVQTYEPKRDKNGKLIRKNISLVTGDAKTLASALVQATIKLINLISEN